MAGEGLFSWAVGFFDSEPKAPPATPGATTGPPAPWRDRLQPGSFRAVPFFVEEAVGEVGRRWQHFEYPGRDAPYSEDLGAAQQRWLFRAYTLGDDYMGTRDRLIAACRAPGPGRLVHPYLGELNVCCDAMRFRESETEGGWCQFDLTFSEAGLETAPVPTEAPGAAMEKASGSLFDRAKDWFSKTWQATGLSDYVSISAIKNLGAVADYLGWLGVPLPGNALLRGLLTALPSKLTPEAIATALQQAVALVAGATPVAKALVGLDILRRFRIPLPKDVLQTFGLRPGGSGGTSLYLGAHLELHAELRATGAPLTPDQAQVEANAAALTALVQQLALAALPTPIANVPLDSYEELAALRASVLLAFDDVEVAAPDSVFNALGELRAAVMREFTERGTTLRPLRRYVTVTSQAAPVLAQRLYQDLDRTDELVARTRAVHPGFLPLSGRVAAT